MRMWWRVEYPRIFTLLREAARLDAINKSLYEQLRPASASQLSKEECDLLIEQTARLQKALDNTMCRIGKHLTVARTQCLTDKFYTADHIKAAIEEIVE